MSNAMLLRCVLDLVGVRRHGTAVLSALALGAAVAAGCKETSRVTNPSETSPITGPGPASCPFDVAPAVQSIGPLTASGRVTVATSSTCMWTATTDAGWITLTQSTSGLGNGTVDFAVAYNPGAERTGSVLIAGQPSAITQAGSAPLFACTYALDPGSQTIGAAGGTGTPVGVSTPSGCRWTAASNAPWIVVTRGDSGIGNGVVAFSVAANTGDARTGTLMIAGRTATISQIAAGASPPPPTPSTECPFTISPDFNGMPWFGDGGIHSHIEVTTASKCAWTASSNDAWITIVTGASGTGNGRVEYAVASNPTSASRRGTLTIAGLTATISEGVFGPGPQR